MPATLECNASGVPSEYQFGIWKHFSPSMQFIRNLNGSKDGKLILPRGSEFRYEDSGIYICNVTNYIPDENGKIWQSGMINVTIEGKTFHNGVYCSN